MQIEFNTHQKMKPHSVQMIRHISTFLLLTILVSGQNEVCQKFWHTNCRSPVQTLFLAIGGYLMEESAVGATYDRSIVDVTRAGVCMSVIEKDKCNASNCYWCRHSHLCLLESMSEACGSIIKSLSDIQKLIPSEVVIFLPDRLDGYRPGIGGSPGIGVRETKSEENFIVTLAAISACLFDKDCKVSRGCDLSSKEIPDVYGLWQDSVKVCLPRIISDQMTEALVRIPSGAKDIYKYGRHLPKSVDICQRFWGEKCKNDIQNLPLAIGGYMARRRNEDAYPWAFEKYLSDSPYVSILRTLKETNLFSCDNVHRGFWCAIERICLPASMKDACVYIEHAMIAINNIAATTLPKIASCLERFFEVADPSGCSGECALSTPSEADIPDLYGLRFYAKSLCLPTAVSTEMFKALVDVPAKAHYIHHFDPCEMHWMVKCTFPVQRLFLSIGGFVKGNSEYVRTSFRRDADEMVNITTTLDILAGQEDGSRAEQWSCYGGDIYVPSNMRLYCRSLGDDMSAIQKYLPEGEPVVTLQNIADCLRRTTTNCEGGCVLITDVAIPDVYGLPFLAEKRCLPIAVARKMSVDLANTPDGAYNFLHKVVPKNPSLH